MQTHPETTRGEVVTEHDSEYVTWELPESEGSCCKDYCAFQTNNIEVKIRRRRAHHDKCAVDIGAWKAYEAPSKPTVDELSAEP